MKKELHIKTIIILISFMLSAITSFSQGEWQWARSYSGQDDPMNSSILYNRIVRSVYDSQGNIYIAGTMGEHAFWNNNGEGLSEGGFIGYKAVLLAKFDPQGNLLWKRTIKSAQYDSYTNWMDIVGDTSIVLLAGSYSPGGNGGYRTWYFDTLIVGQYPNPPTYPLNGGSFNCFVTFDLDGNKQSEYFLRHRYYIPSDTYARGGELIYDRIAPFHIDKNGYIYIFTHIGKPTNADTIRIVVNNQKIYPLENFVIQNNTWLLKFSPDFDLVWSKQMVRDTSGIGNEHSVLTRFSPYPTGITVDDEENLYLTGYLEHTPSDDTTYYREVHLGSSQKLIINDAKCRNLGFIIKYDTIGEPIWANQVFGENRHDISPSFHPTYYTVIFNSQINNDDNNVYILGWAYHFLSNKENGISVFDSTMSKLYFDDGTPLRFNLLNLNAYTGEGIFFARLNKETGKYISHGTSDGDTFDEKVDKSFVVRNNQVIRKIYYLWQLHGIDTVYTGERGFALVRWNTDGELVEVKNIISYPDARDIEDGNTIMNDNGELFITGMYSGNISFGDIHLSGSSGNSNAFMAKYKDTTFLHPYVSSIEDIENEKSNNLIIYPNPAYNDVSIKAQGEMILDISLYNMSGQLIFWKQSPKAKIESLSLVLMPKGVYVLKVRTHKNVYTRKLIRN